MGGWGSGSAPRSGVGTTNGALRLDIGILDGSPAKRLLVALFALESPPPVEVEFAQIGRDRYWFNSWVGTRTRYGLRPGEVSRGVWYSDTSVFISVTATPANLGGHRLWFACPRPGCRRRCTALYREVDTNPRAFACRRCTGLVYRSQRQSRSHRLETRANRLVSRLVPAEGTAGTYLKPKWMRWSTFDRLTADIDRLDAICRPSYAGFLSRMER